MSGRGAPKLPNIDVVLHDGNASSLAAQDFRKILVEVLGHACRVKAKPAAKKR